MHWVLIILLAAFIAVIQPAGEKVNEGNSIQVSLTGNMRLVVEDENVAGSFDGLHAFYRP